MLIRINTCSVEVLIHRINTYSEEVLIRINTYSEEVLIRINYITLIIAYNRYV